MLIMRGSYRAQGLFARPICNLAYPIRSDNPSWGLPAGASGAVTSGCSDKKSLHYIVKSTGADRPASPISGDAGRADSQLQVASFRNARSAAAAPRTFTNDNHARN